MPLHSQLVAPLSYSVHFHSWGPLPGVANTLGLGLEGSARITCWAGSLVRFAASPGARGLVLPVAWARVASAWAIGVVARNMREMAIMARAVNVEDIFMGASGPTPVVVWGGVGSRSVVPYSLPRIRATPSPQWCSRSQNASRVLAKLCMWPMRGHTKTVT